MRVYALKTDNAISMPSMLTVIVAANNKLEALTLAESLDSLKYTDEVACWVRCASWDPDNIKDLGLTAEGEPRVLWFSHEDE